MSESAQLCQFNRTQARSNQAWIIVSKSRVFFFLVLEEEETQKSAEKPVATVREVPTFVLPVNKVLPSVTIILWIPWLSDH